MPNTNIIIIKGKNERIPIWKALPKNLGPLLVVIPSIYGNSPDVKTYAKRFSETRALVYVRDSF